MKLHLYVLIFFLTGILRVFSQDAMICGTVKDSQNGRAIPECAVKIQGSDIATLTDSKGRFRLENLKPGAYYLVFSKKSFFALVLTDVKAEENLEKDLNVEMCPGNENEYLFLEIGGIQVTASRQLIADQPETVHRISSGEIEHMQANSLADVLDMIPGNEKNRNPGLQQKQVISLRGFGGMEPTSSLFGTRVIVDDVPLSNNSDLQTGVGVGYGAKVQNTAGTQYDLREVVAENLEKVEVVAGASSVEYGDHTAGLILVKSRTKNVPTRFKWKNNPDTREANLMGDLEVPVTDLAYNLNYGYSERDIRITGDEYHRISAALKALNSFLQDSLSLTQTFRYNRKIEEDNNADDPYSTKAYNRDNHFIYSHQIEYKMNPVTGIYWRNYVDYNNRNSWRKTLETADLGIWTDLITNGTRDGIMGTPSYFSDVRTRGEEWSYGSKFKISRNVLSGDIVHRLLLGAEFSREENHGQGKWFDVLKPPGGNSGNRPRTFNDIPGMTQLALFAEDRITGTVLFPYTLEGGFRLDSYNPSSFTPGRLFKNRDVFEADQGTFFNPRFGLKINLAQKTQVRFSFGKSSKIPSLSSIYPEDFFLDVYDATTKTIPDGQGGYKDTTITLVSTYVYDNSSPHLKGFQSTKYEIGFDHQIGSVGLSVVGYYQKETGLPRSTLLPYQFNRYLWPNWPDSSGRQITESTVLTSTRYGSNRNLGWSDGNGIEFSLETHRIEALNMRFRINAAYNFKKYGSKTYPVYSNNTWRLTAGDTLAGGWIVPQDMQLIPFYQPVSGWRQRTVVNYSVDYIAKPLGVWLTFKAQHVLWDKSLDADNPRLAADGYYLNGQVVQIDPTLAEQMGLTRSYSTNYITVDDSKPNNEWLFSIVVSKSLFRGAEVSLFVENIFNDKAYYVTRDGYYSARNPEIFWGIAFSSVIDRLFRRN